MHVAGRACWRDGGEFARGAADLGTVAALPS